LMFNVVPAVFFLAAGLLIMKYRINRTTLAKVETQLAARRQDAT